MSALIQLNNVGFRVGEKTILNDINFSLCEHETVTIVGPNGAGKSTFLSLALGLRKPTTGSVVTKQGLRMGYVPQFINRDYTIPITVRDFVKLTKEKYDEATRSTLLEELDLNRLADALLSHLSGGELRRLLLARALLNKPNVLILDEPTAGVDVAGQSAFYQRLNQWRERQHFAILMVSHDLHLVMASTDRVICLNQNICCQGKPMSVVNDEKYTALFGHSHLREVSDLSFYRHRTEENTKA